MQPFTHSLTHRYQYPVEEIVLAMVAVGIDPDLVPEGSSLLMR